MKFVDEIDCLIKKYDESRCFIATNEYGKELQKIYKQIVIDLDSLKSDYYLIDRIDKRNKLERKIKKARKEKKRWKKKYLELRDGKESIEMARIRDGFGLNPINKNK